MTAKEDHVDSHHSIDVLADGPLCSSTTPCSRHSYSDRTESGLCDRSAPLHATTKKRLVVLGQAGEGYAFLKSRSYATLRQFDVKVVSPYTSFSFTPLWHRRAARRSTFAAPSNRSILYNAGWSTTTLGAMRSTLARNESS